MAESQFLADLHGRFGAPRDQVVDLVRRVTGAGVADLQRIARGYDNEVYRVDLDTRVVVYVRIRRDGYGFDHEPWAMSQARDHGVPVPTIIGLDRVEGKDGDRPAMVIAQAPGRQLKELLPGLTPADRHTALTDLGRVLTRLHQVRTPGVWRPGDDGTWPDPAELRRGYARDRRAEHDQLVAAGLTAAETERTLASLDLSPDPPERDFVLCHGDLSPEHVFVDTELRVSCLIDWGMWHGGSVTGELAYVSTTFSPDDFAAVLEGHGYDPADDDLRRKISLSVTSLQIGHIAHHVTIGDHEGTAHNVAALRRALAELEANPGR